MAELIEPFDYVFFIALRFDPFVVACKHKQSADLLQKAILFLISLFVYKTIKIVQTIIPLGIALVLATLIHFEGRLFQK